MLWPEFDVLPFALASGPLAGTFRTLLSLHATAFVPYFWLNVLSYALASGPARVHLWTC